MKKNSIIKYLNNPFRIFTLLGSKGMLKFLPDKAYLTLLYYGYNKKKLELNNPRTFNEKIQWLKLNDRNPLYTSLVDKYEVRLHIEQEIGGEFLVPLLGVWDQVESIDFYSLPDQFVMKTTHDSGGVVICKDKKNLDINEVKRKLNKSLNRNYFYFGREWPYKNVKPRIIAEELLVENNKSLLTDYKFFCFNGDPQYCQVIRGRGNNETIDFYDKEWEKTPFNGLRNLPFSPYNHLKPEKYDIMLELAKKLSKGIPFVRVDFYYIGGKIYFGELTFYPQNGFGSFNPPEWDLKLGKMIKTKSGTREIEII